MRRIYSTLRPPIEQKSYVDWLNQCNQKVSVSSKGLIAFTSSFCLNQSRPRSTSYHVYVADGNAPYRPYLVVDSAYDFTIVEWDPSGTKLLVCDVRGSATIYTSREYLVSDWKLYFQQVFAAETFISAIWYHSGLVTNINLSNQNLKNPSNHLEYNDKIQQNKFGASLRMFGGKPAEGCVLVSKTGLVCCLTLVGDGSVHVAVESLSHLRTRIEVADICHHKDGSFVVGTSAGDINSTIALYQIKLNSRNITIDEVDSLQSFEGKRIYITCKQFNSFHLNIVAQMLSERENSSATFERVSQIKFVTKDSPDDVLVEVSGQNLSLIELWELEAKRKVPINGAILELKPTEDIKPIINSVTGKVEENTTNQRVQPNEGAPTRDWTFKGNYINDKDLVTIRTPKFRLFGSNRQLNVILLAYKDSTITCLRKEDLQPIDDSLDLSSTSPINRGNVAGINSRFKIYNQNNGTLSTNGKLNSSHNSKASTNGNLNKSSNNKIAYITDIQITSNQTAFIAIDSMSQLHAIKLPELITCQDSKDEEVYLQYLLEYCLITGNDWWDVLVCVKQDLIDNICDKFHDAYERQPKYIQRKYFNRQLMIRASLYRCLNSVSSLCKASDCHTMIMLNSIGSIFKSMVRSHTDQDSPTESLSNFLKTQGLQASYFNINQVVNDLNEKEFYLEINLIQRLQPLSQWVCDLAIYLVVSVPQRTRNGVQFPGTGLAKNKEALEIIRELLVIIKIWANQSGEVNLPKVHKLTNQLDVFGTIFRLISILYTRVGNEPEELFVEECVHLANNITVSEFSFSLTPIGVASPLLHCHNQQHLHLAAQSTATLPSSATSSSSSSSSSNNAYLTLEFFRDPSVPELVSLPKVDGAVNMKGERKIDVVRNISLGAHPVTNLKHCTRCKSVSLIKPEFQTSRGWEQRWISSCVCGGSWAQSDGSFVNKVGLALWSYQNSLIESSSRNHQMVR